jgi:hypothetical protein
MYHKVGLTAAFRLSEPGYEEEPLLMDKCCCKSGFTAIALQ